jgi:single-strand DNA-binding protein
VKGRLNPDPATGSPRIFNRQDGTAGASFEVTASQVLFLSSKLEHESAGGNYAANDPEKEEIPF